MLAQRSRLPDRTPERTRPPETLADAQHYACALEAEAGALRSAYGLNEAEIAIKRERLRDLSQLIDAAWGHVRRLKYGGKRQRGLI